MTFSARALQAIRNTPPITCIGCSCEVEYEGVEFTSDLSKVVGYTCACGTTVSDGIYMGASAMARG